MSAQRNTDMLYITTELTAHSPVLF